MKAKVYFGILWRLVFLFIFPIVFTDILNRPRVHQFLGDTTNQYGSWDWSSSHAWLMVLLILLFILSLINFIVAIVKLLKNNYDTSNWGM